MTTERILDIIADETGLDRDELTDDSEFPDLGVDDILARTIITHVRKELQIQLAPSNLRGTIADLKNYLSNSTPSSGKTGSDGTSQAAGHSIAGPLSFVLQGTLRTCNQTLFLLPDGGGSAMAYARLPRISPQTCLVGLNSPFLRAPSSTTFTVEAIGSLWAAEIQRYQPSGPYLLGGWSAGGYYAFEVAKLLIQRGEEVRRIVLIDSPCRLNFEALPMQVVRYLSTNDLMGNWGNKPPPQWLIDHFDITIRAIERYTPDKIQGPGIPDVSIIWAADGLLKAGTSVPHELDMNVKVTRMLLERPECSGAMGWDRLFPGARIEVAQMPGNHFTIVYPPYCESLSVLLNDVVQNTVRLPAARWLEI